MKYFLMIIVLVIILIFCANGCENLMVERRGGKIVENSSAFANCKKIECDGHQFYLKSVHKSSPMYIHAYDCGCSEVTSVDSTLCKLYGIRK